MLIVVNHISDTKYKGGDQQYAHILENNIALKSGDIIFRRGLSLTSKFVLMSDPNSFYSHVGMIVESNGNYQVVHVVPAEDHQSEEKVKKESLKDFLHGDKASNYAVYRLREDFDKYAQGAAKKILSFYKNNVTFDNKFDVFDSEEMYCTELVYRAFKDVGIDIIDQKFDSLRTFIKVDHIILPSTIINSKYFYLLINY